jgi:rhodanese-related sulfurtransferase
MTKKRHSSKPNNDSKKASYGKRDAQGLKGRQRFNRAWLWIGLGLVLIAASALFLLLTTDKTAEEIPAAQAYQRYQQGAFFLDVRSQKEWEQSHIPGSTNIPLDTLQGRLTELPRNREIVVVCLHGPRSKTGMAILKEAGFERVTCLSGGIQNWISDGYPLE